MILNPAFPPTVSRGQQTPPGGLATWNGLGLLLREQRNLRRPQPRRDAALSPYASLRRRVLAVGLG